MTPDFKQAFLAAVPKDHQYAPRPGGPADDAVSFATFRQAVPDDRAGVVAKHLAAIGLLMDAVTLAEVATVHRHRDETGPVLDPDECDRHRGAFSKLRLDYLRELYKEGIEIDLADYADAKTKEVLLADDPCRLLRDRIEWFREMTTSE